MHAFTIYCIKSKVVPGPGMEPVSPEFLARHYRAGTTFKTTYIYFFINSKLQGLSIFCGCKAGVQSESDLVGNPEDLVESPEGKVSHDAAHIMTQLIFCNNSSCVTNYDIKYLLLVNTR